MNESSRSSFPAQVYQRMMGVGRAKLTEGASERPGPTLADVLYYGYQRGLWSFLRGLLFRVRLAKCGGRLFVGRHTTILFPGRLSTGRNVAIGDFVFMNCFGRKGVRLGHNVRIREFGWLQVTSHLTNPGAGIVVGDNSYIGPHCVLGAGGGITIGRDVTVGAYVQVLAENHGFSDPKTPISEQGVTRKGVVIEDGCWLGNGVIVLDGVTIGRGAVIGAGSVVTRNVPAGAVVTGSPARVLKQRCADNE